MEKDWTGKKTSKFVLLGASSHASSERETSDFYATDPAAVIALLKAHKPCSNKVLEPACGEGHISQVLEYYGYTVYSSDLVNRGYGEGGIDFLQMKTLPIGCRCILTNPPYRYTNDFIEHSLALLPPCGEAIFLLNINNLAGQERYNKFYSNNYLAQVFLFYKRQKCAKNGNFASFGSSAVNYAWFVFRKDNRDLTTIQWI